MRSRYILGTLACACLLAGCQPKEHPAATNAGDTTQTAATPADQLLLAATKIALPPPGITGADLPDPHSTGAEAVATYCAQCHNLPAPTMHSATDWPGVVRRMWLRMDMLPSSLNIAVPDQGARAAILSYLMDHALQVSGANLPAGEGREDFALICSRCHALPDPRVHASQDWLAVFRRMETNMQRMRVTPPTPEQTRQILSYLQATTRGS